MSLSDFYENKFLDLFFNRAGFLRPDLYIALGTDITEDQTGSTFNEVSGLGYGRMIINRSYWTISTKGTITNLAPISWIPGPLESWGTASHYTFVDELTGGNLIMIAQLPGIWELEPGIIPTFHEGDIIVTLD